MELVLHSETDKHDLCNKGGGPHPYCINESIYLGTSSLGGHDMRLIQLNFKIIFSSILTYLFFAFNLMFFLFFFVVLNNSPFINYTFFLDALAYYEIALFILSFCLSAYFSHKNHTLEKICFVEKQKYVVASFLSVLLASYIVCLIPVSYILIASLKEGTGLFFNLLSAVYFLLRWISILSISQAIGYLVGFLIKKNIVYLLAAPFSILFSHLNEIFFSKFLKGEILLKISNLFSLQKPFMNAIDIDYSGPRIDLLFIVKQLIVLTLVFLLISIIKMLLNKKIKLKSIMYFCSSTIILGLLTYGYICLFPQSYNYSDKLYALKDIDNGYKIRSYEGSIHLSENSNFYCIFEVEKGEGDLTVRLDKAFQIENLFIDGNSIKFSKIGDYIFIPQAELPPVQSFKIELSYSGRVQYINDVNCVNIYTSFISSALPPNFAFIPIIDGDRSIKNYSFDVVSSNNVISNLVVDNLGNTNHYRVNGVSSSFCIFSGFLETVEKDGMTIYRTKYNQRTDYWNEYQDSLSRGYLDPYTGVLMDDIPPFRPKKVFMIYYLYGIVGYPVAFDNYVMLNYGYTR